jgi:hypothetical protein
MEQSAANTRLQSMVTDELGSAFKDYCAALTEITDEACCGRGASPQQVERAEAAKLRLENARTFFELCVCRRDNAPGQRHVH